MTLEELKAREALFFENIREGLQKYPNNVLKLSMEEAWQSITKLWKKNGNTDSFVDFYYFTLPQEAKDKIALQLNLQEIEYLKCMVRKDGEVIFPLDETLLSIAVKLNASEMLFSTFYFTRIKSTWWGNYNREYIVFREDEDDEKNVGDIFS